MVKRIVKNTLKVVATVTIVYVIVVGILIIISPKLVPKQEEDDDLDASDLGCAEDEYDVNDFGHESADYL